MKKYYNEVSLGGMTMPQSKSVSRWEIACLLTGILTFVAFAVVAVFGILTGATV